MAELVLQISSLSFQYECSRINLNILKLFVTYLGFCGVYSFLFSTIVIGFPYYVGRRIHVLFQIRARLKIVPLLVDKSFLLVSV